MQEIMKKENRTTLIVSIICFVLIAVVATYTYSFFAVNKTNSAIIAGEAESLGLTVVVDQLAPDPSRDLIPQMDEYITSAIIGRNGSCVDDNGNTVCHTYKITVTNANVATKVSGTLTLDNKQNPNLRWAVYNYVHDDETGNIVPALVGDVKMPEDVILVANEDFAAGETKEYYIVVWIRETGMIQMDKGEYSGVVNFFTGNDVSGGIDTSGANAPALTENLIPVKYNEVLNSWVKADSSNFNSNWYNYDDKRWANAVLVKDSWYYPVIEKRNKVLNIVNEDIIKYTSFYEDPGIFFEYCDYEYPTDSDITYTFTTGPSGGVLSFKYEVFNNSWSDSNNLTITLNGNVIVDENGDEQEVAFCVEEYDGECDFMYGPLIGYSNKEYSTVLSPNTEYTMIAKHTQSCSTDFLIPASIYDIKLPSDLVSELDFISDGDMPWSSSEAKNVRGYRSYEFLDNGKYSLKNDYLSFSNDSSIYGKYICSDGISSVCDKIYQIKTTDNNNRLVVDSYATESTTRDEFLSSGSGTLIDMNGILAQYVWIPRYKYKVWNINKEIGVDEYDALTSGIEIEFEDGISTTGDVSCNYDFSKVATETVRNEECSSTNGEKYYTHPAFTFGEDELTGFWIGKYELSSEHGALIKPGLRTKDQIFSDVGEVHNLAKSMQGANNVYGLSTNVSEVDSHIITNMEWGAMAYLTNSNYGMCSDGECFELAFNDTHNEGVGVLTGEGGSTTDNIYGIYDTVGGSFEFVMGNMSSRYGIYEFSVPESGFIYNNNTSKYLTTYAYELRDDSWDNPQITNNRTRLGDAAGEINELYDFPFVSESGENYLWIIRSPYGAFGEGETYFWIRGTYDSPFDYATTSRFVLSVFP